MFITTDISHDLFKLIRRCLVNEHLTFKESKMKGNSVLILTTLVTVIFSGCATTGQLIQSYQSSSPELYQYKGSIVNRTDDNSWLQFATPLFTYNTRLESNRIPF